jgi:pantothenate kinase
MYVQFRATGGGAYKFADLFKERLGVTLKKEDEIGCLVAGCNFLLRAILHEAFEFRDNECHFMSHFSGKSFPPINSKHIRTVHSGRCPILGTLFLEIRLQSSGFRAGQMIW